MSVEIEAKLKVDNHDAARQKLRELGAVPAGRRLEINALFDTDDRSLRACDKGLRVRVRRNLEDGTEDAFLTFKGPQQPGHFKNREEIETGIEDAEALVALLSALGYKRIASFEKRRESWELSGCKIELDEVPRLGCFVEIEGPGEEAISDVQAKLGLARVASVRSSYMALLTDYLQEHGGGEHTGEQIITFPH